MEILGLILPIVICIVFVASQLSPKSSDFVEKQLKITKQDIKKSSSGFNS